MTDRTRLGAIGAWLTLAAIVALLGGAVLVGVRFGTPAVVLWFAFAALAGGILLFWESLRVALDPTTEGDEGTLDPVAAVPTEIEERKRSALRALKDLQYEHSIQRLSDEDFAALSEKYRAEARSAMEAMDRGLSVYLPRAEELVARAASGDAVPEEDPEAGAAPRNRKVRRQGGAATTTAGLESATVSATEAATRRACAACSTTNDADAVFCKKCGARVEAQG
jgi:hypothetical protein